jgi:hypothetical protein
MGIGKFIMRIQFFFGSISLFEKFENDLKFFS